MPTNKTCRECGCPSKAQLCSSKCSADWNNRRRALGAMFYDLFMTCRFEREAANQDNVWSLLCRLASECRDDDIKKRDGRKSWRDHKIILAKNPWLKAQIMGIDRVGRGGSKNPT